MSVPGEPGRKGPGHNEGTAMPGGRLPPAPWPQPPGPPWAPGPAPVAPPTANAFWPNQPPAFHFGRSPAGKGPNVRLWWWLTIAAALLAVGLVVAVVVYRPDHAGGGAVSAATLADVLLSPREAAHAVGAETLSGEPVQDKLADTPIVDEDCVGVLRAAEQKAYERSGFTGVRSQDLGDDPGKEWRLTQAVVSFPDAQAATSFVADARASWQRCANREVNTRNVKKDDPRNIFWTTGSASEADGILAMDMIQEAQGWNCQRALSARSNVVIDLDLCGRSVPGSVVPKFVTAVDKRIDAH
jgi:hypothetical protein